MIVDASVHPLERGVLKLRKILYCSLRMELVWHSRLPNYAYILKHMQHHLRIVGEM